MLSEGKQMRQRATLAREKGQFIHSLSYSDQALLAFDALQNPSDFAEALANRSITLRVYAGLYRSRQVLTLAKYEMLGSVAIARASGDARSLSMPLYNLAQIQEDLGELPSAVLSYREAVAVMEEHPPEAHNRPSVLANMKLHMETCEYASGDKTALSRALLALSALEHADEPSVYNKLVWISGGYLRLARILREDDNTKARMYLEKAKEIIDTNPELVLRRQQLQQIEDLFTL